VAFEAESAGFGEHVAVDNGLVKNIVHVIEENIISTCDGEGGQRSNSSVSEEEAHVDESKGVESASREVVEHVLLANHGVESIVGGLVGLRVEHHVAQGLVLVPSEVSVNVHSSQVKRLVVVAGVARLFVSVAEPVEQVDDLLFSVDTASDERLDIEGEVFVSLDVTEGTVQSEQRV